MQLKGTRIHNGMAFLEPATVNLLGGRYSELEEGQLQDFKRGLYTRLGYGILNQNVYPSHLKLSTDDHFPLSQRL